MEIRTCMFTKNPRYKDGRKITPKGIMVHSTGANNPNLRRYVQPDDGILGKNIYQNDWNRETQPLCVHAFIGKDKDGEVRCYQVLPWDARAYHCGSGKNGSGNSTHISFEICEDGLSDRAYFEKIYSTAAKLCAYLCGEFDLTPQNVICHAEGYAMGIASNHGDVLHWFSRFGKTMDDFRNKVAEILKELKMTQERFNEMMDEYLKLLGEKEPSEWSEKARRWAEENGYINGDENGDKKYKKLLTREELIQILHNIYNED